MKKFFVKNMARINRTPLRYLVKFFLSIYYFKTWSKARSMAAEIDANLDEVSKKHVQELREQGFTKLDFLLSDEEVEKVLAEAERLKKNWQEGGQVRATFKNYWVRLIPPDTKFGQKHPFINLVLDKRIRNIIASYLKTIPFVNGIATTLSLPSTMDYKVSQLWHRDMDDTNMLKLIVYCTDVTPESGPFNVIKRPASATIKYGLRMRHYKDDFVFNQVSKDEMVQITGPKGTCLLVDTGRCFHMGSRIPENGKERMAFFTSFTSLPAIYPNFINNVEWDSKSVDKVDDLMLRGTYVN